MGCRTNAEVLQGDIVVRVFSGLVVAGEQDYPSLIRLEKQQWCKYDRDSWSHAELRMHSHLLFRKVLVLISALVLLCVAWCAFGACGARSCSVARAFVHIYKALPSVARHFRTQRLKLRQESFSKVQHTIHNSVPVQEELLAHITEACPTHATTDRASGLDERVWQQHREL